MQFQLNVIVDAESLKDAITKMPDGVTVIAGNVRPQQAFNIPAGTPVNAPPGQNVVNMKTGQPAS